MFDVTSKSWWISTLIGFIAGVLQIVIPMMQAGTQITTTQWIVAAGTVLLGILIPGKKDPAK